MRRLLAVTMVVAVLAVGAGCSAGRSGGAGPTGEGSGSAAGSGGAPGGLTGTPVGGGVAGGNAQVCAEAQQAGATAVREYVEALGRMVAAVGAGDTATADAARTRAQTALAGWRAALREQSARSTDPQLKTLLSDLGTEVAALGGDVESIDETELDRLQQRLDQLCAR
ncbi:hypothetical protein OOJ91_14660 [Micromonospora lupini]|uniref:hypothetical protein n=1 Tax=Micromonospora lupini TaxID=285679 RepID=UPI0022529850|nr:hypothetical protein [Micromonospora lupini]MCX5067090.1 hypothetical protein [Micromonospora lupini]